MLFYGFVYLVLIVSIGYITKCNIRISNIPTFKNKGMLLTLDIASTKRMRLERSYI